MTIKECETRLFDKWKQETKDVKGHFVSDGVVSEEVFLKQETKYVFILKEVNDLFTSYQSLCDFLRDGAPKNGGHTWNPICRWVDKNFKNGQSRKEVLNRIAAINLKKHDECMTTTDMSALQKVVLRDRKYILEQIKLYQGYGPTVFVCCGPGMFDLVANCVCGIDVSQIDHNKKPTACYLGEDAFLLAFSHPNSRKGGLDKLFQEYINNIFEKKYANEFPAFPIKKAERIEKLYEEAVKLVREHKRASVTFIQSNLNIGFRDATKIIDLLEDRGIVGPASSTSPREVFM
jgi:DNA segregation ATPase FtsK/SpoIIIE-like protein